MNRLPRALRVVVLIVLIVGAALYYGIYEAGIDQTGVALDAPGTAAAPTDVQDDWTVEQTARANAKTAYIASHQEAYDWFTLFPFSETDGTPLIILKLLPLLAPDVWGEGGEFLSVVGLFHDERHDNPMLPSGVGFSGMSRAEGASGVDYTSFTCAACHVGRVRGPNGELQYIDAGINAEFNINLYFVKLGQTLAALYGDEQDPGLRTARVVAAMLNALDQATASSPNFFYANREYNGRTFDAAYEAEQVALFRANAEPLVQAFVSYTDGFVNAFTLYLDKSYDGFQSQMLAGLPGMADATGVSSSHGYELLEESAAGSLLANGFLPESPGLTDFMAVWEQESRTAEWDATKQQLINGGGQYNGNIPVPMYRNLAASMTMGLANTDIRVAAFAAELLEGMPATVYPFTVDAALAQQGETLFAANCAGCHQPHNGRVYTELGTNPARSNVINTLLMEGARAQYKTTCGPDTTITMYGQPVQPCAEFKGVPLAGMDHVIMRPLDDQRGYNATPLKGVWAVAPYLHNGSVPTLYHLLVPSERPASFIKSQLDYDTQKVGFAWETVSSPFAYTFDTNAFHAVNNHGHDTDLVIDGVTYKLNWSDDIDGALALVEYLKTL